MIDWLDALVAILDRGDDAVLVTVAELRGSGPRDAGAHMVVTFSSQWGTIGGGNLEFQALAQARKLLRENAEMALWRTYPLGPALGQCCGGAAALLFEPVQAAGKPSWVRRHAAADETSFSVAVVGGRERLLLPIAPTVTASREPPAPTADAIRRALVQQGDDAWSGADETGRRWFAEPLQDRRTALMLFGAGHVGQALTRLLDGLPFRITWIDQRADLFPCAPPANAHIRVTATPVAEVATAPAGAFWVIMTHDHDLDLRLCSALLQRGDFEYAGLIGSDTKRARFAKRLREQGLPQARIDALRCPIGIDGISGKKPQEVALATAAELMIHREALLRI